MCLLTFLPENVDFDYERARVSAQSNPDGFGFAIHAGVAIVKDHDMDFEKLWLRWIDLRKTYRGPALFHFRITTHGDTNISNCLQSLCCRLLVVLKRSITKKDWKN